MPGPIGLSNDIGGPESYGQETGSAAYLGRISGKLLASNLERNGFDLTIRNTATDPDILYIDVNSNKIGVNCTPTAELDVNGTTKSNVFHIDSDFVIGNVTANKNSLISSLVGNLRINVKNSQGSIRFPTTVFDKVKFQGTSIAPIGVDQPLFINSATAVEFSSATVKSVEVLKNVSVTDLLRVNGTLYLGDNPIDTIVVNTDFTQDLVPHVSGSYSFGTSTKRWKTLFANTISNQNLVSNVSAMRAGGIYINGVDSRFTTANDRPISLSSNTLVSIQSITFNDGAITNLSTISPTHDGYVAFTGLNGVVIPTGSTAQRETTEAGGIRWNSTDNFLEVYTGDEFKNSMGSPFVETEEDLDDILHAYSLILG